MRLSILLASSALVGAFPTPSKRDDLGNYTTSIKSVQTPSPTVSTSELFSELSNNLWQRFWDNSSNWVDTCGYYNTSNLWSVAVAGRAVILAGDSSKTAKSVSVFAQYKSTVAGGYSASTAKDSDIYTDDDSQVVWAFRDAYEVSGDQNSLQEATDLLEFVEQQKNPKKGGITWNFQGEYIASISTLEAALAALKVYEIQDNSTLIDFAKYCLEWTFDNLLDSEDGLIFDGESDSGDVNEGKLTYTIGVAISSLAYLSKWDQSQDWISKAVELGVRSLGAGNLNSQFFTNGYINDTPDHTHLFYAGFADLLELTSPSGDYQTQAYTLFKNELIRETRHVYDQYNSVFSTCSEVGSFNTLLSFGSLTQIFYQVKRVADRI